MKPTRKGLGKGLAALISEAEPAAEVSAASRSEIPVDLIDPNPFQPRQVFDDESIEELKQSILARGVLQPILLRKNGERFQIIVGERRWRATKSAGLPAIPATVREDASDEDMLELAILENIQRKDLNPIEAAQALLRLQNSFTLTQEAMAEKLGVSRPQVANMLRLLKLPAPIQAALADGKITMGHARTLLSVPDARQQQELFQRFLADGRPTVREAEELTRTASGKKRKERKAGTAGLSSREQLEISRLEERLSRELSMRVKIKPRTRGGVLEIQFFSNDDFQRLLELLEPK